MDSGRAKRVEMHGRLLCNGKVSEEKSMDVSSFLLLFKSLHLQ